MKRRYKIKFFSTTALSSLHSRALVQSLKEKSESFTECGAAVCPATTVAPLAIILIKIVVFALAGDNKTSGTYTGFLS